MSELESRVIKSIGGLSDDKLRALLIFIENFSTSPEKQKASDKPKARTLGVMKGQKLIADGYDIDECNDEVAQLFGV